MRSKTSMQRLQALGRLKKGEMNKAELAFKQQLELRKHAGEVAWYAFESVKLIIAPNTSITVDFFVMLTSGELQAFDVKGSLRIITDDAKAKMKVAASMFPWPFFYAIPQKKSLGGNFQIIEV